MTQGTESGWLIDSEDESVVVFKSNATPIVKADNHVLLVRSGLNNWQAAVADLSA